MSGTRQTCDVVCQPAVEDNSSSEHNEQSGGGRRKGKRKKNVKKASVASKWSKRYFEPSKDHPQAFAGTEAFVRETKEDRKTKNEKRRWLETQTTHQLHVPARKHYDRRQFVVYSLDEQWQLDLSDVQWLKTKNNGYAWMLFAIDVLSRYLWVVPLKNKSGPETADGIKRLFKKVNDDPHSHHTLPLVIYVDKGSEFYNKDVRALLKQQPIPPQLRSGHSSTKAAIVERVQRTVKTRLWKYFHQNNTYRWIDVIDGLVDSYNNAPHASLGGRVPASVTRDDEKEVWDHLYAGYEKARSNADRFKFEIGDIVRISKQASIFKKGYLPQWTQEWFRIRARGGPPQYYRLEDYDGEDRLDGTFYPEELQKVTAEEQANSIFRIESVLKRRVNPETRKKQIFVKYQGWPDKYNAWIDEDQLE